MTSLNTEPVTLQQREEIHMIYSFVCLYGK